MSTPIAGKAPVVNPLAFELKGGVVRAMTLTAMALIGLLTPISAWSSRLKDIAVLKGVRNNQLLGYGIVVGLSGTGDKASELTEASLSQALKGLGVDLKTSKMDSKNTAAVLCSATLPPFTRNGTQIDVTISSIGTASSLEGGTLLVTSLRGPDGNVYAMAQGKVVISKRPDSSKAPNQSLVVAQVPNGAIVEKELALDLSSNRELRYQLAAPDFTTAARISRRINEELGGKYATAVDAGSVDVIFPYGHEGSAVDLIAQLESIDIESDRRAKVIINPRSGTVVFGERVQIAPVAIAHNNLRLEVKEEPQGGPAKAPAANADAPTKEKKVMLLDTRKSTSIADVVGNLNDMGASADDLVYMLQALRQAGALMADLEIQ